MNMTNQEYSAYIDKISPNSNLWGNIIRAFLAGGLICVMGQGIMQTLVHFGMEMENAKPMTAVILIFLGSILTGLNAYDNIAHVGKAGTLIPITGFANAVVSPAMEFKAEGYVVGLGAKLFTVAGPVLVYGSIAATIYGLIYAVLK